MIVAVSGGMPFCRMNGVMGFGSVVSGNLTELREVFVSLGLAELSRIWGFDNLVTGSSDGILHGKGAPEGSTWFGYLHWFAKR
ncbi:hypothetical protein OPV22_006317 [Ensete ventricosum]|uniref:Uncharacterized protein n=1 Tax=Ensete ventricosum TaxID=4639 RepID=A0AAV8RKK7_ENSVE|nr:hypothetical protein OPV22_006317 [Ensete ventricosum]